MTWLARTTSIGILLLATAAAGMLRAAKTADSEYDPAARKPDEIRNVSVVEHLGAAIPLDAAFTNERGEKVPLSTSFNHGRPIVLQLGYFECPMLCSLVSQGLVDAAKTIGLKAGTDFDMLFVSIAPLESPSLAAMKKDNTVSYYGKPGEAAGFHFMVGDDRQIHRLTDAVGFNYQYVPATHQYAHAAVLIILTPDGHISRYLYGTKFPEQTLRLSLVEASSGKIGNAMDQVLLICLHYDSSTGKYSWAAIGLMRVAGVLTLVVLSGAIALMLRWEFRRRAATSASQDSSGTSESQQP